MFFQSVLLAGYAYADLTTRLGARRQALLHVGLLVVSLACLPIIASSGWKPRGEAGGRRGEARLDGSDADGA